MLPYTEAQALAPVFDRESYRLPASFGEHNLLGKNMDLQDLIAKIDWTPFFHFWGFKGKFPEIIHQHEEADRTYQAALEMLGTVIAGNEFEASIVVEHSSMPMQKMTKSYWITVTVSPCCVNKKRGKNA